MTLPDIIARLEKATTGDRELDSRIHLVAIGIPGFESSWRHSVFSENIDKWCKHGEINQVAKNHGIPEYSSSIDAALALLPGESFWMIGSGLHKLASASRRAAQPWARIGDGPDTPGATSAIAICIAALKARETLA